MSKSFKDDASGALSPALKFISTPDAQEAPGTPEAAAAADGVNGAGDPVPAPAAGQDHGPELSFETRAKEKRNKRMQILVTPTLYERIRAAADDNQTSANELIYKLIEYGLDALDKRKGE